MRKKILAQIGRVTAQATENPPATELGRNRRELWRATGLKTARCGFAADCFLEWTAIAGASIGGSLAIPGWKPGRWTVGGTPLKVQNSAI